MSSSDQDNQKNTELANEKNNSSLTEQALEFISTIAICAMINVFFYRLSDQIFGLNLLSSIMIILLIFIKYAIFIQHKRKKNLRKLDENVKPKEEKTQKKQVFLKVIQLLAYLNLENLDLIVISVIYISFLEQVLSFLSQINRIILISYFMSHFTTSHKTTQDRKKIKVIASIIIQQVYTLVRLQLIEFNVFDIFLNTLYILSTSTSTASYFSSSPSIQMLKATVFTKKQSQLSQQQQQTSKNELLMHLYQSILSIIPDGLAVINSNKKLIYANPTLKRILQSNKKSQIQSILMNLGQIDSAIVQEKKSSNNPSDQNNPLQRLSQNQSLLNHLGQVRTEGPAIMTLQSEKKIPKRNIQSTKNLSAHLITFDKSQQLENGNEGLQQNLPQNSSIQNCILEKHLNMQQPLKESDSIKKKVIISSSKQGQCGSREILDDTKENDTQKIQNIYIKSNYTNSKDQQTRTYYSQSSKIQFTSKPESKQNRVSTIKESSSNNGQYPNNNTDCEIISYQGFGFCEKEEESAQKQNQQLIHHSNSAQQKQESQFIKMNTEQITSLSHFHKSHSKNGFQNAQNNFRVRQQHQQKNQQKSSFSELKELNPTTQLQEINQNYNNNNNTITTNNNNNNSYIYQTPFDHTIGLHNICFNESASKELNEIQIKAQDLRQEYATAQTWKQSKLVTPQESMKESDKDSPQQSIEFRSPLNLHRIFRNNVLAGLQNGTSFQNSIPFALKVKEGKNKDSKPQENAIECKETNVSKILDTLFKNAISCRKIEISKILIQSEKNVLGETVIDKSEKVVEKIEKGLVNNGIDNQNQQQQKIQIQRNGKKKQSFLSHFGKKEKQGFTYIQQSENLTKIQVKYKERDLVLQFLSVDALQENSKKDSLVLIMVQDMWQEMYQRKVDDIQKDKMRIFASLSHELRTPLNCSISMLEVLRDEISSRYKDLVEEYINPALFSNKLLLNQINDILDFVQMDSGKFKYSFLDFSVEGLFKDCQKLISMQAQMKDLEIRINCDPNVPDVMCSDPNRIRQIILNFLSNSLKFTKKGFIEIGITNWQGLNNGLFKIYVQDTGIGITKENLEAIFQFCGKINYEKKDEGLNTQGCGLGLTISNSIAKGLVKKEIAEGGIQVSSDYGYGSTFSIIVQDMNFIDKTSTSHNTKREKFQNTLPPLVTSSREEESQIVKSKQPKTPLSITQQVNKKVHSFGMCNSPTRSIMRKYNSHNLSLLNTDGEKGSLIDVPTSSFDQSRQKMIKPYMLEEIDGKCWTERKLIHPISSGLKAYDSSIVVDNEEEEISKKIQQQPNFEVHINYRFQEEDFSICHSTKKPFSTTSYQTQVSQQLGSQDQEGFTSYVGFSRFNENCGAGASSRIISTSYMNMDRYMGNLAKTQAVPQYEYTNVDDNQKLMSQSMGESCVSMHKILDEIINRNQYTKQNCDCYQIMIVDDNQFNLYALAKIAKQFSFECILVSDGMQALEEIDKLYQKKCCFSPKLIFMDIEMPQKNGYEVTKEIIQFYIDEGYDNIPVIIACTAYVGQEDHQLAIEAGMSDFINKPILKTAFQQLIVNWNSVLM